VEALQNYQQVERDYRARYKQRVERQFRIGMFSFFTTSADQVLIPLAVKPNATAEEISSVVNDTSGSGDQIFAQAVRYAFIVLGTSSDCNMNAAFKLICV
jgi:syntaxin 1B/2/3